MAPDYVASSDTTERRDTLIEKNPPSGGKVMDTIHSPICSDGVPPGQILDGKFQIMERLSREKHADVYSVKLVDAEPTLDSDDLEARAIDMRDLPPPLARHRARSLKRLKQRSVLRATWDGLEIVVYRKGKLQHTPQESETVKSETVKTERVTLSEAEDGQETEIKPRPTKASPRTAYQRESARLRQRDRRRNRRERQTQSSSVQDSNGEVNSDPGTNDIDDDAFAMLTILYMAQSSNDAVRSLLSKEAGKETKEYLASKKTSPDLKDDSEMEAYVQVKDSEIAFLRRQLHKVPVALELCRKHMGLLLEQQRIHPGKEERLAMQRGLIEPTKTRFRILRKAMDFLPEVIASAEDERGSVARGIPVARQERLQSERREQLDVQRQGLHKRVCTLTKWTSRVVPASATFTQLHAQLEKAQKDLAEAEEQFKSHMCQIGAH